MDLMVNPVITDFRQDVNGDIKMLKLGANKEDAWANIAEQGGSAKLDNNKTATIDVSAYTEPVVVNPTSGKDGMKKATITLSNIPSGGVTELYAWERIVEGGKYYMYTTTETPAVGDSCYGGEGRGEDIRVEEIVEVGENTIAFQTGNDYTRNSAKDITF